MKATKKIVGAACALVAAVALSAGSTFAWFSSNDSVTVSGMKVQAKVPENLYIYSGLTADISQIKATKLEITDTKHELSPAKLAVDNEATPTKVDVSYAKTYTTDPDAGQGGIVAADGYQSVGSFSTAKAGMDPAHADGAPEYVALYPMTLLRAKEGATTGALNASVTISFAIDPTTTKDATYKFINVGFFVTESTKGAQASDPDVESGAKFVTIANDNDTITDNKITFDFTDTNAVLAAMKGNVAYKIQFAVWFNGDDTDCFVGNALETHEISVEIVYSIAQPASGS